MNPYSLEQARTMFEIVTLQAERDELEWKIASRKSQLGITLSDSATSPTRLKDDFLGMPIADQGLITMEARYLKVQDRLKQLKNI